MQIWAAPLTGYRMAVLLVNRHARDDAEMTVHWDDIGLPAGTAVKARDLWLVRLPLLSWHSRIAFQTAGVFSPSCDSSLSQHNTLDAQFTDKMAFNLTSHTARMFVLTPLKSQMN
jgi:alpha-galactosidase